MLATPTNEQHHTFKMEEDIGLIVLEHLGNQFDIHVLDIDLLEAIRKIMATQ